MIIIIILLLSLLLLLLRDFLLLLYSAVALERIAPVNCKRPQSSSFGIYDSAFYLPHSAIRTQKKKPIPLATTMHLIRSLTTVIHVTVHYVKTFTARVDILIVTMIKYFLFLLEKIKTNYSILTNELQRGLLKLILKTTGPQVKSTWAA